MFHCVTHAGFDLSVFSVLVSCVLCYRHVTPWNTRKKLSVYICQRYYFMSCSNCPIYQLLFCFCNRTPRPRQVVEEYISFGLQFQSIRVHNGGAKAWKWEELRLHILIHKQEAERTLGRHRSLQTSILLYWALHLTPEDFYQAGPDHTNQNT